MPRLQCIIEDERRKAAAAILEYYAERYHPHAMLLPNARFGLYAAARELLSPGDRVLISPITCRTVIEALRAAGMRPVLVDIELQTGNIDVSRLGPAVLDRARAIVTTNLYGNPDRANELRTIARRHGLLLIEDCAQVLHTVTGGQRIGSIGDVSVFSFKKYFDEVGGAITIRSQSAAQRVAARVEEETKLPRGSEERGDYIRFCLKRTVGPLAVPFSAVYRCVTRGGAKGATARYAERAATVPHRLPTTAALMRVAAILRRIEAFAAARMADAASLVARCPLPVKTGRGEGDVCFLVVPFFSEHRDAIVAEMERQGIPTYFRYTPPMNELFREYTAAGVPDPRRVQAWCQRILPINVTFARQYLDTIARFTSEPISQPEEKRICKA